MILVRYSFVLLCLCLISAEAKELASTDLLKGFADRAFKSAALPDSLRYRLFIPKNYSAAKKYPIMITLHGAGQRGDDNAGQLLTNFNSMWSDSSTQAIAQSFVIAPQCPNNNQWVNTPWANGSYTFSSMSISNSLTTVMEILDSLSKEFSLDTNRYYISGLSMGGFGTWYLMMKFPNKFAAAIPVCGGADPKMSSTIKNIPVWTFHSVDDNVVPVQGTQEMVAALVAVGGKPKYDEFPASLHFGHNAWDSAAATKGLAAWLFSKSKNGAASGLKSNSRANKIELNGKTKTTIKNGLPLQIQR